MKPASHPLVLVAASTLWVAGCSAPPNLPAGDDACRAPTLVQVLDFIDGDTADVRFLEGSLSGSEERIRLIGIDTPEINHSDTASSECYAVMAWNEAAELQGDQEAWLSYDAQCQDFFGRTLAYISRRSDLFFLNEHLVAEGFGRALSIPPSDHFRDEFATLEVTAQEQARGLWGEPCYGSTR
jgi:micrococcal nuclease